jgi:hypothetical protein
MLRKNITKITWFVILGFVGVGLTSSCGSIATDGVAQTDRGGDVADFERPMRVGVLRSPELKEASGVAASKCQPNVYWAHNDSGDEALLYAIDGTGEHLGVWRVTGAKNRDWEDVAAVRDQAGKCQVLIGDIGNNELNAKQLSVYRVAEPTVDNARRPPGSPPSETAPAETLNFQYPGARRNAETLMVHPTSGDIYVLTKSKKQPVSVYKLTPDFSGAEQKAVKVAEFSVPAVPNGMLTGGDISPDGKRVVLCDYVYGYELSLPALSTNFDDIWKQRPQRFSLGDRNVGEAVAYTQAGDAVVAISEEVNTPVFLVKRK